MYKIEGEAAKALSVVEAKLEALNARSEQEFNMLQDEIREIVIKELKITKEDIDNKMWNLVAKYYPQFGFYIAEMDTDNLFGDSLVNFSAEIKPTIQ